MALAARRPADSDGQGGPCTLRLVAEGDLRMLEALDKEVFQDLAYSMAYLRSMFDLFRKTWYVAERDGTIAGHVLIAPNRDNTEAWLAALAVSPGHRERGVGHKLMRKALETCGEVGVCDVYITVRPHNDAAYQLYREFGFVQDGEERADYYGNSEPRKVLHRSLGDNPSIT